MSQQDTHQRRKLHRSGSILLMVLVAIIIMSLTTSTYLLLMRNEHLAARYSGNRLQADMLTQSGIEYLRVFLDQTDVEIEQQGGLINNPNMLQDVLVIDDTMANYRGRFTVVAPDMVLGQYQNLRYGLENESAKLNLNALLVSSATSSDQQQAADPRERLLVIPGMNEEVADAILDWIDEDDSPRSYGAESSHYQSLAVAYLPRNGPLRHLDELLMVRGVTPELLYGQDTNRNYLADPDESPVTTLDQLDNSLGQLNRGWSAYLTVQSLESNLTSEGESKVDLNSDLLQSLHGELQEALGAAEANFIIAFRQYGPADESAEGEATAAEALELGFEKESQTKITSLLDLIDARVRIEGEDGKPHQIVESPWQDNAAAYRLGFADLMESVTTDTSKFTAGRINVNLASRPVLLAVPGMTEALADQIISSRNVELSTSGGDQQHPTWPLADGLVTLDEMKPMLPFLTTGGTVYNGQIVGYFEVGTARSRAQVLLDRSGTKTELLDWQNLNPLGPGFSLTQLSSLVEQIE